MSRPATETSIEAQLAALRHVALDMDGSIYKGGTLFDCTRPFLANLDELGIGYTFLTNNSSKSVRDYVTHLAGMGMKVHADQFVTSGGATMDYLQEHYPEVHRLFILGTESLREEFVQRGFELVGDSTEEEPDAVIVGFDTGLVYDRLCTAGYWIEQGKPYIATHPDRFCPTDQKTLLLDCGALCACLGKATGRSPDVVLGKPHPSMLNGILRRHHLEPAQLALAGDRLSTDVAMARTAGAMGVLLLSGEATAADVEDSPTKPDLVVADLAEFGQQLLRSRSCCDAHT